MKAIGYTESKPIHQTDALIDIDLPMPEASGRDLLIQVRAIAVNPVDFKIRQNVAAPAGEYKVLGWDAVGEVVAMGTEASLFQVGDVVYYAGDLTRQGSNAEYQRVDERLVGHKPKSLSDAQAAALPLTTITAWELLFEHLLIAKQTPTTRSKTADVLLIVGAAGGVGSILVQLAKTLTGATVIATASRPESQQWVQALGADHVIDHTQPLAPQLAALGLTQITHVASLTHTNDYLDSYVEMLKPMGKIALIDDPQTLDVTKLKRKSISLHWEFMFTRSMFNTDDMQAQHQLLNEAAALIDEGYLQTTLGQHLGVINANNLKKAHQLLESGSAIGKIVLEGF